MNTLKKVGVISYYPAKPAVTGTPAYCETIYVKKTEIVITNNSIYEKVTYVPELRCYPEKPSIPAIASETKIDAKRGWNAGAVSNAHFKGNCEFSFEVPEGVVGVIAGLSDGANNRTYSHIAHGFLFIQDTELGRLRVSIIESGVIKAQDLYVNYYANPQFCIKETAGIIYYGITYSYDENYSWSEVIYTSKRSITAELYAESTLYTINDRIDNPRFIGFDNYFSTSKILINGGFSNHTENSLGGTLSLTSQFSTGHYFLNKIPLFKGSFIDSSILRSAITLQSNFVADNTPNIQVGSLFSPIPFPIQAPSLAINGGFGELSVSPITLGCFMSDQACYGEFKTIALPSLVNRFSSNQEEADQINHQEYLITQFLQQTEHALLILFTETLQVNQVIDIGLVISIDEQESLRINDEISFNGLIELVIQEKIKLATHLATHDKKNYQYAVNASSFALSLYDNFDFTAFARCNGVTYGIKADGLYRLNGITDIGSPITAEMDIGAKDWGMPNIKRVSSAYLGVRSDGDAYLKVVVDDKHTNIYRLEDASNQRRTFMAKGVAGRYWRMRLVIEEASYAELDSMEFELGLSQRRVGR